MLTRMGDSIVGDCRETDWVEARASKHHTSSWSCLNYVKSFSQQRVHRAQIILLNRRIAINKMMINWLLMSYHKCMEELFLYSKIQKTKRNGKKDLRSTAPSHLKTGGIRKIVSLDFPPNQFLRTDAANGLQLINLCGEIRRQSTQTITAQKNGPNHVKFTGEFITGRERSRHMKSIEAKTCMSAGLHFAAIFEKIN